MPHPQKTHPPPTRSASICGFSLGLFLLSLSPRYSILGEVSRLAPLLHFVFALALSPRYSILGGFSRLVPLLHFVSALALSPTTTLIRGQYLLQHRFGVSCTLTHGVVYAQRTSDRSGNECM